MAALYLDHLSFLSFTRHNQNFITSILFQHHKAFLTILKCILNPHGGRQTMKRRSCRGVKKSRSTTCWSSDTEMQRYRFTLWTYWSLRSGFTDQHHLKLITVILVSEIICFLFQHLFIFIYIYLPNLHLILVFIYTLRHLAFPFGLPADGRGGAVGDCPPVNWLRMVRFC